MKMKYWLYATPLLLIPAGMAACDGGAVSGNLALPGSSDDNTVIGGSDNDDNPTNDEDASSGNFVGGELNTFDHDDDLSADGGKDPFEILEQRQEEGPPEIRTRLHSCQKIQIAALRNILVGFGVDLDASGDPKTAGELLSEGQEALGGANYPARSGEAITWTNSGATKLLDIFAQAAPEIIANLADVEQCQVEGVGVEMFDSKDQCQPDAITCLIGRPATETHVAICNQVVQTATTIEKGKQIAVATLLSAAHTCE